MTENILLERVIATSDLFMRFLNVCQRIYFFKQRIIQIGRWLSWTNHKTSSLLKLEYSSFIPAIIFITRFTSCLTVSDLSHLLGNLNWDYTDWLITSHFKCLSGENDSPEICLLYLPHSRACSGVSWDIPGITFFYIIINQKSAQGRKMTLFVTFLGLL